MLQPHFFLLSDAEIFLGCRADDTIKLTSSISITIQAVEPTQMITIVIIRAR